MKHPAYEALTTEQLTGIDALCDRFHQELVQGRVPRIENFLTDAPAAVRDKLLADLLAIELEHHHQHSICPTPDEYLQRFPQQQSLIAAVFESLAKRTIPQRIGRYRIEKVLGQGGFGTVYLAHDEQLNRRVAVKVPHSKLISKPEDAEAYLAEARAVANLDHPVSSRSLMSAACRIAPALSLRSISLEPTLPPRSSSAVSSAEMPPKLWPLLRSLCTTLTSKDSCIGM